MSLAPFATGAGSTRPKRLDARLVAGLDTTRAGHGVLTVAATLGIILPGPAVAAWADHAPEEESSC
jgi:hypothetical protein